MSPESNEGQPLEKEVRIEARPETVFPFFTDPAKMTRWKGRSAVLDPRPGRHVQGGRQRPQYSPGRVY